MLTCRFYLKGKDKKKTDTVDISRNLRFYFKLLMYLSKNKKIYKQIISLHISILIKTKVIKKNKYKLIKTSIFS